MKRGRHAAADGSFGRSAGTAALRGTLLIVAAFVLGVVLLRATDSPEPFADIADDSQEDTTTTAPEDDTTTTTSPPARDPSEVAVLVANGTTVGGAAGRTGEQLTAANYNVVAAVDATSKDVASTVVLYAEGYEAEAAALAASLGDPAPAVQPMPAEPPVTDLRGAQVLVVLGADLASGEAATSTTATTGG